MFFQLWHVFRELSHVFSQLSRAILSLLRPVSTSIDVEATTEANRDLGMAFFPSAVGYIANNPPRYDLFGYCATLLVRKLAFGEELSGDEEREQSVKAALPPSGQS